MPFYIRKSLSFGPIRFNLSNAGIGVSAGIKGFRVGSGPRGNYVHVGRNGLYYRASLSRPEHQSASNPAPSREPSQPPGSDPLMLDVDSANTGQIVDASSQDIIEEMRGKKKLWHLSPWIIILGISIVAVALNAAAPKLAAALGFIYLAAYSFARSYDENRKTTVIFYNFEDQAEGTFKALYDAFEKLSRTSRLWHIPSRGTVRDGKYHAGANELVSRKSVSVSFDNPRFVKTNIPTPNILVGSQRIYFFPDRFFIFDGNEVGALGYESVLTSVEQTGFIESESIPADSKKIGQTWRYVNKKGGPDRRFKDNRELPIMQYEQMHLRSGSGLNELLMVSRVGAFQSLANALKQAGNSSHPAST